MHAGNGSIMVCGLKVDTLQIPEIISRMELWVRDRSCSNYIVTTNAHTIVTSRKNKEVVEAVNNGSLSIADGFSLVFASRFYGRPIKKRAYGPDLMLDFLKVAEQKGYSNFFYGSTEKTLEALLRCLKQKMPGLKIAGCYSPVFSSCVHSQEEELRTINSSGADVLWVGLGGIKQERWMYEHKDKLKVPVLVGVGAAFDFLAGTKPQAPLWMREAGLEWLFRLLSEPRRLWRRYLVNNTLFILYVLKDLAEKRFKRGGRN